MSLWANRRFSTFFVAFSLGNIGDWFDIFALQIIFAHNFNASPFMMAGLTLFYFLPGFLFGSIAGVIADKYSKRQLIVITDLTSMILTLGLYLSHHPFSSLVFLFLRGTVASLNGPTVNAYSKLIVEPKYLLKASSYLAVVFQLAKVIGPLLGAGLLLFISARSCLLINTLSFALTASIIFSLPKDEPITHEEIDQLTWIQRLKQGWAALWQQPALKQLLVLSTLWFMCGMLRLSQMAIFLRDVLPHDINALGVVLGLDGLGAVITSSWLSRKATLDNYFAYFLAGFVLIAIGTVGIAEYQQHLSRLALYIPSLVIGLGSGINVVVYGYMIRKLPAEHQVGSISGLFYTFQNAGQLVATVIGGFWVTFLGAKTLLLFITALIATLALYSTALCCQHVFKRG